MASILPRLFSLGLVFFSLHLCDCASSAAILAVSSDDSKGSFLGRHDFPCKAANLFWPLVFAFLFLIFLLFLLLCALSYIVWALCLIDQILCNLHQSLQRYLAYGKPHLGQGRLFHEMDLTVAPQMPNKKPPPSHQSSLFHGFPAVPTIAQVTTHGLSLVHPNVGVSLPLPLRENRSLEWVVLSCQRTHHHCDRSQCLSCQQCLSQLQLCFRVAAMSSLKDIKELYRRLGVASSVHSTSDQALCTKLVETLKAVEASLAQGFVQAEPESCLLSSYSFDPTSTLVSTTSSTLQAGAPTLVRKGKLLHELLMQRMVFIRDVAAGQRHLKQLFCEPRLLTEGKGQWHVLAACSELLPLPRRLGHKGPLLQHLVADRGQLTSVGRLLRTRQELFYSADHGACDDQRAKELELTDFFFQNGCILHDAQNALKWAVAGLTVGDALQNSHIIMESLRNSAAPILKTALPHVQSSLTLREPSMVSTVFLGR